jgi:hypothetical protein
LSLAGTSLAGPVEATTTTTTTEETWSAFSKGNTELELLAGYFWGIGNTGSETRPDTAWGLASLRYGWMLNDPSGDGIFRGNCEFLIGAYGGPIFEGPGSFHVGADLALRYNFVQPNATVVPYFQIIAGGGYSDAASDDEVQNLLGSDWSWELGASIGIRWMLSERTAFVTAIQWQHFSNAGTNDRNRGYNGLGGMVGLSWFYD